MDNQPVIEVFLPTYRTDPGEIEKFYPSQARAIGEAVVKAELDNQVYDEEDARQWSVEIGNKIREAITKDLNIPRYKIVIQTTIGQMRDQGIRVASRCLWDLATDNYSAINYTNQTLFCNVLIFALYTD